MEGVVVVKHLKNTLLMQLISAVWIEGHLCSPFGCLNFKENIDKGPILSFFVLSLWEPFLY